MTTLIRRGLVYDGVEQDPQEKDILIRGDKIVRIGSFPKSTAQNVVDASGAVVAPGFLDVSSDIDHYLGVFSEDIQRSFIRRGITTVIGGNFGLSLAPLARDFLDELYKPADSSLGNVHWHSVKEYLKVLQKQKLLLNFGTMVGSLNLSHPFSRNIRGRKGSGLEEYGRACLGDGAFGISVDFRDMLHKEVSPRAFGELARAVSFHGGVLSVRLHEDQDFSRTVRKLVRFSGEKGVRIQISHVKPTSKFAEEWDKLNKLLEASGSRTEIHFDFSPNEYSEMPVYGFLPESFHFRGFKEIAEKIMLEDFEKDMLEHFQSFSLDDVFVGYVPEHLASLRGKSLSELAEIFGMSKDRALLHLMRISRLKAVCLYKDVCAKDFQALFGSQLFFISPDGVVPLEEMLPSSLGLSIGKIQKLGENARAAFGDVISKMTSYPARAYGISKRGAIRESFYADIVVLKEGGVSKVFVGGRLVYDAGKFLDETPGNVLRKS
ncbi:hypothetical protein CL629_04770 [bacterium]|nr:hypothetical protein [bacterium]|tara:strand:- start:125 stop:1597 length:1473 start_codon:yes stop_codon:yes gene_type:complete